MDWGSGRSCEGCAEELRGHHRPLATWEGGSYCAWLRFERKYKPFTSPRLSFQLRSWKCALNLQELSPSSRDEARASVCVCVCLAAGNFTGAAKNTKTNKKKKKHLCWKTHQSLNGCSSFPFSNLLQSLFFVKLTELFQEGRLIILTRQHSRQELVLVVCGCCSVSFFFKVAAPEKKSHKQKIIYKMVENLNLDLNSFPLSATLVSATQRLDDFLFNLCKSRHNVRLLQSVALL